MANTQMYVLQLQVPIIAGDIVEATSKAHKLLNVDMHEVDYTFFQVLPANVGKEKT